MFLTLAPDSGTLATKALQKNNLLYKLMFHLHKRPPLPSLFFEKDGIINAS